tara:strand:- start:1417 stop:1770 length:354 start_codon:yes stop_codon:yes gene_type:complete
MNDNFESEEEFTEYHIAKMEELSVKFAKAKADRNYLDNYRKTLRAKIALEHSQKGVKSFQSQTLLAEADDRYLEIIKALHTATRIETQCYWELERIKIQFERWRTIRADYRASMNMK